MLLHTPVMVDSVYIITVRVNVHTDRVQLCTFPEVVVPLWYQTNLNMYNTTTVVLLTDCKCYYTYYVKYYITFP